MLLFVLFFLVEDTEVMPYVSNFEIKSDMIQEIKEQ